MTVRLGDATGEILFARDGVISTPSNGKILFECVKTDFATAGDYVYDVQITNGTQVFTVINPALCTIVDDVTK